MTVSKVAVVLSPDELHDLIGLDGFYGACLIDDNVEQCFLFRSKGDLENALIGYSSCPSGYTDTVGTIDLDVELSAIARIVDLAATKLFQIKAAPDNVNCDLTTYENFGKRYYQGIKIKFTEFGLDIAISNHLIDDLGWKEGDRLKISVSPCSGLFKVGLSDDEDGVPELIRTMDDPHNYSIDRVFVDVPIYIELRETDWISVPFHLYNKCILLSSKVTHSEEPAVVEYYSQVAPLLSDHSERRGGVAMYLCLLLILLMFLLEIYRFF